VIDIHTHLLPGVDDGAKDIDQSLAMIRAGVKDGIEDAVVTPHILGRLDEAVDRAYTQKFEDLRSRVEKEGLPIRLFLGSEIMFGFELEGIGTLTVTTFNGNGRYFLIEVPMMMFPDAFETSMFRLRVAGLVPILAHPDRYPRLLQTPERIHRLAEQEILMQLDANTLTGPRQTPAFRVARSLIERGMAHFVASDAHGLDSRPFALSRAKRVVEELAGPETAHRLFVENPRRSIEGEPIERVSDRYEEWEDEEESGLVRRIWRALTGRG